MLSLKTFFSGKLILFSLFTLSISNQDRMVFKKGGNQTNNNLLSKESKALSKERKLDVQKENSITVTIEGGQNENVLFSNEDFYYYNQADAVYVNGVANGQISYDSDRVYIKLTKNGLNTIKFVWNNPLTSIKYIFYYAEKIISVDFSKFDSSSLTDVSKAFFHSEVKNITMPNFNALKITKYEKVFDSWNNLEFIDITNYKGVDIFESISKDKQIKICYNGENSGIPNSLKQIGAKNICYNLSEKKKNVSYTIVKIIILITTSLIMLIIIFLLF